MQLQEATSTYVCNYNWLIHQHVHMCCECASLPHVQYGVTPFLAAAAKGHIEVASFLLDNGSSILELSDVSDHQLLGTSYT